MPKLLIAHGGAPTAVLNASLCGAVEAASRIVAMSFCEPRS